VAQVFSGLLRRTVDGSQPGVDYLLRHKDLLDILVKGCAASQALAHAQCALGAQRS
jgi:hypothetical protein